MVGSGEGGGLAVLKEKVGNFGFDSAKLFFLVFVVPTASSEYQ